MKTNFSVIVTFSHNNCVFNHRKYKFSITENTHSFNAQYPNGGDLHRPDELTPPPPTSCYRSLCDLSQFRGSMWHFGNLAPKTRMVSLVNTIPNSDRDIIDICEVVSIYYFSLSVCL